MRTEQEIRAYLTKLEKRYVFGGWFWEYTGFQRGRMHALEWVLEKAEG